MQGKIHEHFVYSDILRANFQTRSIKYYSSVYEIVWILLQFLLQSTLSFTLEPINLYKKTHV